MIRADAEPGRSELLYGSTTTAAPATLVRVFLAHHDRDGQAVLTEHVSEFLHLLGCEVFPSGGATTYEAVGRWQGGAAEPTTVVESLVSDHDLDRVEVHLVRLRVWG